MVEKTTKDGVVQLYLNGELKLEQEKAENITIGTRVEYDPETWEETQLPPEYDKALAGSGSTLSGVTVSWDGEVVVDEGGIFSGIQLNGGTFSASGVCRDAAGWYGAGLCMTATTADGGYFTPGVTPPEAVRGAIFLSGATFSGCAVNPLNGYTGHGGAVETYGGTLSVTNAMFSGNSANGSGAAGGAMALMYSNNTITGGTFSGNSAYFGGAVQQNAGTMTVTGTLFSGNSASGEATETYPTGNAGGALELHQGATASISGCTFSGNTAGAGGAVYNDTFGGAVSVAEISGCTFSGNTAEAEGGAIWNDGVMTVAEAVFKCNSVIASDSEPVQRGGAIVNTVDGVMTITDCRFSDNKAKQGGAIWNEGVMTLENVSFVRDDDDYDDDYDFDDDFSSGDGLLSSPDPEDGESPDPGIPDSGDESETENNTFYNSGSLIFRGSNDLFGTRLINEGSVTFCVDGEDYVVRTFGSIDNTGSYLIEISEEAASRAGGALFTLDMGAFTGSISVKVDEMLSPDAFTFDWGGIRNDLAVAGNTALRFMENEFDDLVIKKIEMEKLKPVVSNDGSIVIWADEGYAGEYQVELAQEDDFSVAIRVATNGTGFDVSYRSDWIYYCHVAETGGAFGGAESCNVTSGDTPCQVVSNANGRADIFFASVDENVVWSALYQAKNTVTGETASITGRNRIRDTFTGSESDANILYLSDADNGDALFMDDIYSEFGEAARIGLIREIRAGAGSDVVDMTSERYTAKLAGMTVRGGAGDDVLWGAAGGNKLFGDAGNDRITGGAGDDVIAGGAGNDKLAGGGGNDIFTFGGNWGADVVSQTADGTVTLWFASGSLSNWDEASLTYTDGENSVRVSGVTADKITLKFGEGEGYDALAAAGAFLESTAEAVYETEAMRTQGVLASL